MIEGKKEKKPVKPVTVKIDDFRRDLNQVVADSGLPPLLLEMILGEMLSAMSRVAEQGCKQDRESWEKACKEKVPADRREQGQACKDGEKDG